MNKRHVACALLALALAGCGEQKAAEQAVRQSLKDPESARFGEFYYNSKTEHACLTTNAKNSMGGYTGDKQVELQRTKEGWEYVKDEENISPADCKEQWADKAEGTPQ